ncbi:MAG: hypothetical protein GX621_18910, partial [Pirellulaceae bacterium]|nr:hypothetical protein [Pirellulaceae bacterium]
FVRLEKKLDLPELLAPTDNAARIDVVAPRVAGESIEDDRGRLVIRAPESLRVNPVDPRGLRAVSFGEALTGIASAAPRPSDLRDVLAFAFAKDPVALTLSAQRRKPQVTVGQLLVARIEDDTLKYEATFNYNVLYSGIKSLRIDVPIELAGNLQNETKGIRERVVDPAPEDLPEGYQAWAFSGETELLGRGQLKLVWEEKLDKLGIGDEVVLSIPRLIPAKADSAPIDRAWGQIVLGKAETIDLRPAEGATGLRPIDPRHDLMDGAQISEAAQAFEFLGPWSLAVTATRYELESVKVTSIEQALARMVVTRADAVAVQILCRLRSAQQRLEVKLPEGVAFDTEPLRINGRPVTLERGGPDQFFIPLTEASVDRPVLVDLRYTLRDNDGRELALPEFPEDPAILKVHLCVYLPDEMALLGVAGPWTNEIRWRPDGTMNWWKPTHPQDDAALIEWLKRDIAMSGDPAAGFETDGRRYVFSTLRPTGPLELKKMDETPLTALVLAILVLGGLLSVAATLKVRVLAVGFLLTAIVLCGVFAPLLARQILDGYFVAGLAIVLVVWLVVFVYRHPPRWPAAAKPNPPAPKPTPAPAPASAPVAVAAPAETGEKEASPFAKSE